MRAVLSMNLQRLIDLHYPKDRYPTNSARQQAFAKDAGVSWSSVQRHLNPAEGKTLDVIADLAVAFHLRPNDLMNPDLFAGDQNADLGNSTSAQTKRAAS